MLHSNSLSSRWLMGVLVFVGIALSSATATQGNVVQLKADLQRILAEKSMRPNELLSQGDLKAIFKELKEQGHQIDHEDQLVAAGLADGHFLVRLSKTPAGERYLKKVSSMKLIYDRLDRVSQQPGGQQLLKDLVKLPDGEKYSRARTPNGVPTLLELLPKQRSGKTRTIRDYNQPTGKIYTPKDLLQRLEQPQAPSTQRRR